MISVDPTASVPGLFGVSAPPAATPADAAGPSSAAFALLLQQLGASAPDVAEAPPPALSGPGPTLALFSLPSAGAGAQLSSTGITAAASTKPHAVQTDVAPTPASDDADVSPLLTVLTLVAPPPAVAQATETSASATHADAADSLSPASPACDRPAASRAPIAPAAVPSRSTVAPPFASESEAADPIGSPAALTDASADPAPATTGASTPSRTISLPVTKPQIKTPELPSQAVMPTVAGIAPGAAPPSVRAASQPQPVAQVTTTPVVPERGNAAPRPAAQAAVAAAPVATAVTASPGSASGGRSNAGDEPADNRSAFASRQAAAPAVQAIHVPIEQPAPATPSTQTVAVAVSSPLDGGAEPPLPAQIVQAIQLQANAGGGEARVKLQPDYLGEVTISIKVEHGGVTASIEAASPEVRDWVSGHEPMLKQALGEQGLRLDRLVVQEETPRADDEDAQRGSGHQQQEPQRQRRQPEPDATFEVLV